VPSSTLFHLLFHYPTTGRKKGKRGIGRLAALALNCNPRRKGGEENFCSPPSVFSSCLHSSSFFTYAFPQGEERRKRVRRLSSSTAKAERGGGGEKIRVGDFIMQTFLYFPSLSRKRRGRSPALCCLAGDSLPCPPKKGEAPLGKLVIVPVASLVKKEKERGRGGFPWGKRELAG